MSRCLVLLAALAACYDEPTSGCIECTSSCPSGLRCEGGFCVEPGAAPPACSLSRGDASTTWACGQLPTAPPDPITIMRDSGMVQVTITNITVNGSRVVSAAPSEMLHYHLHYSITDTACGYFCPEQLEIGFVPGTRVSCPFDEYLSGSMMEGDLDGMVPAPSTPDAYSFRIALGQDLNCGFAGTTWYFGEPDDTETLARICVH